VGSDSDGDAGVDVVWKPNGQTQLTATVNPDFGQVESDDLVVNFSATETFISDKRPFFTENQGLFEFTTPSDYSQLLYTRRVGGPADDGEGSGDITAALKLNGSFGATKYGVFGADEGESVGRTFGALRVVRDFAKQNLGFMATHVDRPYLDREASVFGVDHNWRPNARWNVRTRVFGSDIEQAGSARPTRARRSGLTTRWITAGASNGSACTSATNCRSMMPAISRATTELPALAGESALHRHAGILTLLLEGLALARQHCLQRSRRGTEPSVPHEPREPPARRQL
jgi:hypothetical protein